MASTVKCLLRFCRHYHLQNTYKVLHFCSVHISNHLTDKLRILIKSKTRRSFIYHAYFSTSDSTAMDKKHQFLFTLHLSSQKHLYRNVPLEGGGFQLEHFSLRTHS